MPSQVPPAVSKAFSAIIPTAITLIAVSIVSVFFLQVVETALPVWINEMLQQPMTRLGQSVFSLMFIAFIWHLLWFFGLHGALIVGPALDLMYAEAGARNLELVQVYGLEPIFTLTRNFTDVYATHGGSGGTLALIIAIFIFSKRAQYKSLSKMALPSGIFQINEPIIFGMPIVLNPIMAIPFVFTPPLLIFIGWFFTEIIPFAGRIYLAPPWTTPPILTAFLATGGSITATILSAATLALGVLIYAPFVILSNKETTEGDSTADDSNT